jgi:hypothetical protein
MLTVIPLQIGPFTGTLERDNRYVVPVYKRSNLLIPFRLRTSVRSSAYSRRHRRSFSECQGDSVLLRPCHTPRQPILRAEGHVPDVAYPKVLRAHSWSTLLFVALQGTEATRYFWKARHFHRRRGEGRNKRRPGKGCQPYAVRGAEFLPIKFLTLPRGDAYAVAQRFWEFSGIFAAPVRLTIALIFLHRFGFVASGLVDLFLKLALDRILGWSSLAAVMVILVAYVLNYPLAVCNIWVS